MELQRQLAGPGTVEYNREAEQDDRGTRQTFGVRSHITERVSIVHQGPSK